MSAEISTDPARRARYSQGGGIYRIIPAGVARPGTVADLRALLERARLEQIPLIPRGAGSAMDGSNVGAGVIVDLTLLDQGNCELDAERRLARVAPSLRGGELQELAAKQGLRFSPDPASIRWATLGGMVGTNAAGPRTARFGTTRDWIDGVVLETWAGPLRLQRGVAPDTTHPIGRRWQSELRPALLAAADRIRCVWPGLTKNTFGYALGPWLQSDDLLDLVIGSEGTLGILSEVTCRLTPIPAERLSLLLVVRDRTELAGAVEALREVGASSVEFLDRTFLRVIDPALAEEWSSSLGQAGGAILSDLEGDDPAQLQVAADQVIQQIKRQLLYWNTASDPAAIQQLWELRRGASPALARINGGRRSLQVIEDGVVPLPRLAEYLAGVEELCAAEEMPVILFGHAGNGHVHANLLPTLDDPDWLERVRRIYQEVSHLVFDLGGVPTGEHGTGRLRAPLLRQGYGGELLEWFGRIKSLFDPEGILNPGILLGEADPLAQLKVGREAAALPEGVAEWLQRIEGSAHWEQERW